MIDDIKYWWEDLPQYIKYWIILFIILIIGWNAWFFIFSKENPENILKHKISNGTNISNISNKHTTNIKANWKLTDNWKDNTTQTTWTTWNNIKQKVKEVAQADNDNAIRSALWLKWDVNTKYLTWKEISLKDIKENDFLRLKAQVHNIDVIDKNILKKYKTANIIRYKKIISENIVKKYWVDKVFMLDKKILTKNYPWYKQIVLTSINNIANIAWNIDNYDFKTIKKCAKVFGKKQCSIKQVKYLKYKNWYIDYNIVTKIIRENSKKYYIIILWKIIDNKLIYTNYILFNKQYWWYGYKVIQLLKTAIQNNNYKIMYLYDKYNVNTLNTAYKIDIVGIVKTILWIKF